MSNQNLEAVILVHGIGEQDKYWYKEAENYIPPHVKIYVLNWFDILDNAKGAKRIRALSKLINIASFTNPWVALARPIINKSVSWFLNRAGDLLGYTGIRIKAMTRLKLLIENITESKVGIIAHSQGSTLVYEYLNENRYNLNPKIKKLITLGSPIDRNPVKTKIIKRSPYELNVMKNLPIDWLNVWGTKDYVCCWTPWKSGDIETFNPDKQKKEKITHKLEKYMKTLTLQDYTYKEKPSQNEKAF